MAAIMATAAPAQAANSGWWWNPSHGAAAKFTDSGDKITVCDEEADGFKAVVWFITDAGGYIDRLYDTGDDGICTTAYYHLQADNYYKMEVCLANSGTDTAWCESGYHRFYVT